MLKKKMEYNLFMIITIPGENPWKIKQKKLKILVYLNI